MRFDKQGDLLPDLWWCLEHGRFAISELDHLGERWCASCLVDGEEVDGVYQYKCRPINLAQALRSR